MNIMEIGERNPNYLGSYDLYDLNTQEIVVTIDRFAEENVVTNGQTEKCAVLHFKEKYKPMILNVENRKRLARLFHTVLGENMCGKKIKIHIEKTKAFGKIHDALRVMTELPDERQTACAVCGKIICAFGKLNAEQMAAHTKKKYGKALCAACATEEAKRLAEQEGQYAETES